MIGFWIAAGLAAALAAVLMLRFAARAERQDLADISATEVAQRELKEIDALAERGALSDSEKQSLRAEAARRLLTAERAQEDGLGAPVPRKLLLALVLVAPIAAAALYLAVGSPRLRDQPHEARVSAWRKADPEKLTALQLEAVLNHIVRENPEDPRPLMFLAQLQAARGADAQAEATARRARALMAPPGGQPDIRGMVEGLAARLKTRPDDPEGWLRLIRAYAVLGETERMRAAAADARRRYAGNAQVLAALADAEKAPTGN